MKINKNALQTFQSIYFPSCFKGKMNVIFVMKHNFF